MSLNWSVKKVPEKFWKGDDNPEWPITNALIWATMEVDLGEITEKNAEEFYRRLFCMDVVYGQPKRFTLRQVRDRIGLSTNVADRTKRQFDAKVSKVLTRRADAARHLEEKEERDDQD